MKAVCAGALGIGCVIFLVLALGSIAAFGPALNSNILNNMSATGMAPLIGGPAAAVSDREDCLEGVGGGGPRADSQYGQGRHESFAGQKRRASAFHVQ
jgi:hypothetical protein